MKPFSSNFTAAGSRPPGRVRKETFKTGCKQPGRENGEDLLQDSWSASRSTDLCTEQFFSLAGNCKFLVGGNGPHLHPAIRTTHKGWRLDSLIICIEVK